MEPQEGAFNARKHTLSLDLKPPLTTSDVSGLRDLSSESKTPLAGLVEQALEITPAQKQYAQGFFDALRSVHSMHNFEFDHKKTILSPGFIAPLVSHSELASPYSATTPTNQRDLTAIIQAMVGTPIGGSSCVSTSNMTTGFPSPFSVLPGPSLTGHSLPPSTSSGSVASTEQKTVDVKQEPIYVSEDSTDNMSERSRSSSVALSQSQGSVKAEYGMGMENQELKKLERKRARNRAAASKCRQKKMDRIQELEGLVNAEKHRGQSLDAELQRLHSTLQQLQRLMERHTRSGCPSQQMSS